MPVRPGQGDGTSHLTVFGERALKQLDGVRSEGVKLFWAIDIRQRRAAEQHVRPCAIPVTFGARLSPPDLVYAEERERSFMVSRRRLSSFMNKDFS